MALRVLLKGNVHPKSSTDIPSITARESAEIKTFFPMDKFFIFGHARSGTTLLARLVRVHPEVHCNWQAHFFTRLPLLQSLVADPETREWLARRSNRWNRGEDLSAVVLRAASDFILERDARQEGKSIVGDKSPNSLMDGESVHLMHNIYPDASLIYIIRDGRDTALSHRFQTFIDKAQNLSDDDLHIREAFIREPDPFLAGERSIFTPKGLRQAAEGWTRNVTETNQAGIELYDERFYSLRYEDLLTNPWDEITRVWEFLGTSGLMEGLQDTLDEELSQNPDAEWQQQAASEVVPPLKKGKAGSWREMFTSADRELFHSIAAKTLTSSGYTL